MFNNKDILEHVGIPHQGSIPHSGRYEWGSGENPNQRMTNDPEDEYAIPQTVYNTIMELKSKGMTEKELVEAMRIRTGDSSYSSRDLRNALGASKAIVNGYNISYVTRMKDKGYSVEEIAKRMNKSTKTINSYLDPAKQKKMLFTKDLANVLKNEVDTYNMPVDIGEGVPVTLGTNKDALGKAVEYLRMQGYNRLREGIPQMSTNHTTTGVFLTRPLKEGETTAELKKWLSDEVHSNHYKIPACNILDDGDTDVKVVDINAPVSFDSKRLVINYADSPTSGKLKDGVIEMRRNVGDLDMGGKNYAQVRILVDNKYYLKGMAVYADDLPDGADIRFNTNKNSDQPLSKVLKEVKEVGYKTGVPTDILGSYIKKQNFYTDKNGKLKQGVLNIVNEEGESWSNYDNTLASQFLSKQKPFLAKQQLDITLEDKKAEFNEIKKLTNPIIKNYYLRQFENQCEKDSCTLKAAAFPRQKWNVILPVTSLKDDQVYAPGFREGEKIALVRYPHAGTFEIPVLTVTHKNKEAEKRIGKVDQAGVPISDAIGINSKVAEQLSGADFDGDTVIAIPNSDGKISARSTLAQLKGFDPKDTYPKQDGMKVMSKPNKGKEMGRASNLITDMNVQNATDDELADAVKYSMVVIDSEKHKLNYQQARIDCHIESLRKKYQINVDENGNPTGKYGSPATLISRAKAKIAYPVRSDYTKIDENGDRYRLIDKEKADTKSNRDYTYINRKETIKDYKPRTKTYNESNWPPTDIDINAKYQNGNPVYKIKETTDSKGNKKYTVNYRELQRNEDGTPKYKQKMVQTEQMKTVDDARKLISYKNTQIERIYADYANNLKDLAKKSRIEQANNTKYTYSQSAAETYKNEVDSLKKKLQIAETFKPLEKKAQALAGKLYKQMKEESDDGIESNDESKAKNIALTRARTAIGILAGYPTSEKLKSSKRIQITDKEWDAMNSGAMTKNLFNAILNNTDPDDLKKRAMPKASTKLTQSQINRIKRLLNAGYTIAEVADHLGVSQSKINKALAEESK